MPDRGAYSEIQYNCPALGRTPRQRRINSPFLRRTPRPDPGLARGSLPSTSAQGRSRRSGASRKVDVRRVAACRRSGTTSTIAARLRSGQIAGSTGPLPISSPLLSLAGQPSPRFSPTLSQALAKGSVPPIMARSRVARQASRRRSVASSRRVQSGTSPRSGRVAGRRSRRGAVHRPPRADRPGAEGR
jgi:hypothetical protein